MSDKATFFLRKLENSLDLATNSILFTTSLDDLEWDSLAAVTSIVIVDEVFGIVLPFTAFDHCSTIQDIIDIISLSCTD